MVEKTDVKFTVGECVGEGAIMRVSTSKGLIKEYPLSEKDLYRIQDEICQNIIQCIKKASKRTYAILDDIHQEGL